MYPSAFIVIFVNIDDFYQSVNNKLKELKNNKMFLSISYDSDLLALENITGLTNGWLNFAKDKNNLSLEIRTKSANYKSISKNSINKNIILSWSLSPQIVASNYEIGCAKLEKRVKACQDAINDGWNVSIVIDPIIKIDNFFQVYKDFINYLKNNINFEKINSFIVGSFRMSSSHLKNIKKTNLKSDIIYYPYKSANKTVFYEDEKQIIKYIVKLIGFEKKTYLL
jgi:spore photoproduct lyase